MTAGTANWKAGSGRRGAGARVLGRTARNYGGKGGVVVQRKVDGVVCAEARQYQHLQCSAGGDEHSTAGAGSNFVMGVMLGIGPLQKV